MAPNGYPSITEDPPLPTYQYHLPVEILSIIVRNVSPLDTPTLAALMSVSRTLYTLAGPRLYAELRITDRNLPGVFCGLVSTTGAVWSNQHVRLSGQLIASTPATGMGTTPGVSIVDHTDNSTNDVNTERAKADGNASHDRCPVDHECISKYQQGGYGSTCKTMHCDTLNEPQEKPTGDAKCNEQDVDSRDVSGEEAQLSMCLNAGKQAAIQSESSCASEQCHDRQEGSFLLEACPVSSVSQCPHASEEPEAHQPLDPAHSGCPHHSSSSSNDPRHCAALASLVASPVSSPSTMSRTSSVTSSPSSRSTTTTASSSSTPQRTVSPHSSPEPSSAPSLHAYTYPNCDSDARKRALLQHTTSVKIYSVPKPCHAAQLMQFWPCPITRSTFPRMQAVEVTTHIPYHHRSSMRATES